MAQTLKLGTLPLGVALQQDETPHGVLYEVRSAWFPFGGYGPTEKHAIQAFVKNNFPNCHLRTDTFYQDWCLLITDELKPVEV